MIVMFFTHLQLIPSSPQMLQTPCVKSNTRLPIVATILLNLLVSTGVSTHAQGNDGDQILDGIGETELIARYVNRRTACTRIWRCIRRG